MYGPRRVLLVLTAVLGLGLLSDADWESERKPLQGFTIQDLEGKALRSADLAGKVAVIDFWATWCAPCLRELPELAEYYAKIRDRKDVVFLSFDSEDQAADLREFVKKKAIPYPVYLAESVGEQAEVAVFPTKLIVDARGKSPYVVFRKVGYTPVAEIEARVKQVLAAPAP